MASSLRAIRLFKTETGQEARLVDLTEDDFMAGDVSVGVDSTINYMDGLAMGVGENHYGGLAQRARVKGDWVIRLPDAISTAQANA